MAVNTQTSTVILRGNCRSKRLTQRVTSALTSTNNHRIAETLVVVIPGFPDTILDSTTICRSRSRVSHVILVRSVSCTGQHRTDNIGQSQDWQ